MADVATTLLDTILVAALLYAVFTDLRTRRISNRLTYSAMLVGFVANAAFGGWNGLAGSSLGWLAGVGIMFIPFALGAMGAGDVKLVAAIGALKGPQFVVLVVLYGSVVGGLLAVFYMVRERRLVSTLRYLSFGWLDALRGTGPKAGAIPYAPAIAAGAILALLPMTLLSL